MLTELELKTEALAPVCPRQENPTGLDSLWWVMHQSDEKSRQTAVVTCYLDESGMHDGAPIAVVAGLLLDKSKFGTFDEKWKTMLADHSITPPLHMKEFRRPKGRLANISNENRRTLFSEVVTVINKHKIYSVAATLTTEQFGKYFTRQFRREAMSVYGMCFILCAQMNHMLAMKNHYGERIAFLMDSGNQYANHVRGAHAAMQEEEWKAMQVGSLTFDKDERWSPLQGADVIAWASRVRAQGDQFTNGYEPLARLFDEAHAQEPYPESAIAEFAENMEALRNRGEFPL